MSYSVVYVWFKKYQCGQLLVVVDSYLERSLTLIDTLCVTITKEIILLSSFDIQGNMYS